MRLARIAFVLLLAGCAGGSGGWVRADGRPYTKEELARDRLECFPTLPPGGTTQAPGIEEARACMRNRGWVQGSD